MPLETSPAGPPPPDLTDPAVLARECKSAKEGLRQQAQASQSGSALAGHPYPAVFFNHCAALFDILGERMEIEADKKPKPAPEAATQPETPPPTAPNPQEPTKPGRRP